MGQAPIQSRDLAMKVLLVLRLGFALEMTLGSQLLLLARPSVRDLSLGTTTSMVISLKAILVALRHLNLVLHNLLLVLTLQILRIALILMSLAMSTYLSSQLTSRQTQNWEHQPMKTIILAEMSPLLQV